MELTYQTFSLATQSRKAKQKGFTLVELIVVITIIATLLAVGVGTIKNVAGSKGVSTGVSLADGIFDHARNLARANGGAKVMIYCDENGDTKETQENFLRNIAVARLKVNTSNEWVITGPGTLLPPDTFFNANLSDLSADAKQTLRFPGFANPVSCYVYEFNSIGALKDSTGDARFVIQSGRLLPGDPVPKQLPKRKRDVGGFRVWDTGKTSIFRNPDQISAGDFTF